MSVYRVSSVGSWTEEMKNDTEKYIRHEENAIKSLEALDEYTQYKYHDDIEDNLLKRKYHIEELKGNFSVLTKYPYRKYYQEGSLKYRLLIRLANFFPGLYKLALRIFKK